MLFTPMSIPDVVLVEPTVHRDKRGFFVETYTRQRYHEAGIAVDFVQDNHSNSQKNTLRGLHMQTRRPQAKLVRCVEGEIFDVAVDLRFNSSKVQR